MIVRVHNSIWIFKYSELHWAVGSSNTLGSTMIRLYSYGPKCVYWYSQISRFFCDCICWSYLMWWIGVILEKSSLVFVTISSKSTLYSRISERNAYPDDIFTYALYTFFSFMYLYVFILFSSIFIWTFIVKHFCFDFYCNRHVFGII